MAMTTWCCTLLLLSPFSQPPAAKAVPAVRGEIASGAALNEILADIGRLRAKGAEAKGAAIDEKTLNRLNTAPAKEIAGNPALLRDQTPVVWPKAIINLPPPEDVADARRRVEKSLATARQQAKEGAIATDVAQALKDAAADLDKWYAKRVTEVPAGDYAEGKRCLKLLHDAAAAASWPDIKEYRPGGALAARGPDVAVLADHLNSRRLRLAPALPNDDVAYATVHRLLDEYRTALRVAAP